MRNKETLAKSLFEKGIIKINPDEPFTWASGIKSPIYTNFRQTMSYPDIRVLIQWMLSNKIAEKIASGLTFDAVIGTSTAGIWIGKLIAEIFHIPFVILKDGNAFEEPKIYGLINEAIHIIAHGKIDMIISGCPLGISNTISLAQSRMIPMGYVRQKPKNHGEKAKIEGNPTGQNAFVIDLYEDEPQENQIKELLAESKITVSGGWSEHVIPKLYDLKDKNVLIVEDLISTGGSLFKEAEVAIKLGAKVVCAASIFTYNFPESSQKIKELNIHNTVHALDIHDLMEVGISENFIKKENELLLKSFFSNPYNWYEINHPGGQINGC